MSALIRRSVHHQQEALFGGRELGDVVVGMRAPDMLLHGAVAFFLGKKRQLARAEKKIGTDIDR